MPKIIFFLVYFCAHIFVHIFAIDPLYLSGIVGVDENGETFTYNGLITKHWVRTQRDEIKIGKVSSKFLLLLL